MESPRHVFCLEYVKQLNFVGYFCEWCDGILVMLKCLQQVLRVLSPANCVQCHSPKQMPATKRKVAIPQLHVLLPVKNFSLSLVSIHLQIYCLPHGATMCLLKIPNFAPLMSFGSTQAVRSSQVMPWHLGEDLFRNSWHLLGDIATVMVERMGDL